MCLALARVLCVSTLPLRLRPRADNRPSGVEPCLGGGLLDGSVPFVGLVSGVPKEASRALNLLVSGGGGSKSLARGVAAVALF